MASPIDDEIYRDLRAEFVDESMDHLGDMEGALNDYYAGDLSDGKAIDTLKRHAHTIKGFANPFGFSLLSSIIHQFEDFMLAKVMITPDDSKNIQKYIDTMTSCLAQGANFDPSGKAGALKALPATQSQGSASTQSEDSLMVFVVTSSRTIYQKIARELMEAGFQVRQMEKSLAAFEQVASQAPDIVIVSDILDTLSGVDVVCALIAMPATAKTPVIFMTSFEESYPEVKQISQIVPIITLGANIKKEIERAITDIELKFNCKNDGLVSKIG